MAYDFHTAWQGATLQDLDLSWNNIGVASVVRLPFVEIIPD